MNMNKKNIWMTGLLVLTLSACSSDSTRSSSTDTGSSTGNTGSNMSGSASAFVPNTTSSTAASGSSGTTSPPSSSSSMSNSGSSGTADTSDTGSTGAAGSPPATPQISYGTVQAIEPVMRQDVGVGAVGAAAAGGSMGSPTDKVYRVTVKMDDGSSQMVVVDAMPSYKTGDRVRYSNGILQQY